MEIEYVHFYVDDALTWRQWFVSRLGFRSAGGWEDHDSRHERVCSGAVRFLLSSALSTASPVADYLAQHPPGVVDVALRVKDLQAILRRAKSLGAAVLQSDGFTKPELTDSGALHWATVSGWGALRHTLVEAKPGLSRAPSSCQKDLPPQLCWPAPREADAFQRIDHVVLNVAAGALTEAVDWYRRLFKLRSRQSFHIQTPHSGLRSQVLVGDAAASEMGLPLQFPINEPESPTSQIQDFLNHNQGSGVQHIALGTQTLLPTVARLRQQQVDFLSVPPSYYQQLPLRPQFEAQGLEADWSEIVNQQVLVDWHLERLEGPLLQIFTRPIFDVPTFFFELIERRRSGRENRTRATPDTALSSSQRLLFASSLPLMAEGCAQGFGEGNFQALFEAMELEQRSRELVPKS